MTHDMTPDQDIFLSGIPALALPVDPETVMITLAALLAMAGVAWRDARTFEIDFCLLGVAAFAMSALIAGADAGGGVTRALGLAVAMAGLTLLVHGVRPGHLGAGDIWLMGFIGLAAGPDHILAVLISFGLLGLLTSAVYSRVRGKRLFRSMFPLALPGMGAGLLALILRLGDAGSVPPDAAVQTLLMLGVLSGAACIGWAAIRQARLKRTRDVLFRRAR